MINNNLQPGDSVKVHNQDGIWSVLSIKKESAVIQNDSIKLKIQTTSLKKVPPLPQIVHDTKVKKYLASYFNRSKHHLSTYTIDLHGHRAHEVKELLDNALSKAIQNSCSKLEVIHGIGAGILQLETESWGRNRQKSEGSYVNNPVQSSGKTVFSISNP